MPDRVGGGAQRGHSGNETHSSLSRWACPRQAKSRQREQKTLISRGLCRTEPAEGPKEDTENETHLSISPWACPSRAKSRQREQKILISRGLCRTEPADGPKEDTENETHSSLSPWPGSARHRPIEVNTFRYLCHLWPAAAVRNRAAKKT